MTFDRKKVEKFYHSPFMKLYGIIGKFLTWVLNEEYPTRKKWTARFLLALFYLEVTIHIGGIEHFTENKHWYSAFPFMESILKWFIG